MHTQEFGAAHSLHSHPVDGQWGVLGVRSPEVDNNLLGFLHIESEIVVSAPRGQLAHLVPVAGLIIFVDETHHSCVVRKLDKDVGWSSGMSSAE